MFKCLMNNCNEESEIGDYCYAHWLEVEGIKHTPDSDELDKDNGFGIIIKEEEENNESTNDEKLNR